MSRFKLILYDIPFYVRLLPFISQKSLMCPIYSDTFNCELGMSPANDHMFLYFSHIDVTQIAME